MKAGRELRWIERHGPDPAGYYRGQCMACHADPPSILSLETWRIYRDGGAGPRFQVFLCAECAQVVADGPAHGFPCADRACVTCHGARLGTLVLQAVAANPNPYEPEPEPLEPWIAEVLEK